MKWAFGLPESGTRSNPLHIPINYSGRTDLQEFSVGNATENGWA